MPQKKKPAGGASAGRRGPKGKAAARGPKGGPARGPRRGPARKAASARATGGPGGEGAGPGFPGASPFTESSFPPGFARECTGCPMGLFMFAMRQVRPEVTEHLVKAGQEVFLAVKALVDQAAERVEAAERLQRIPVL
ncbi:MAG: hypothetical protein HY775_07960 [Acidobacteria bacterium]|nr:hypothetical protein [Acidobacteriota bacterium]